MKIKTRILIGLLLIYVFGFYYMSDMIINEMRPRYLEAVEETLNDTAHLLAAVIENDVNGSTVNLRSVKDLYPSLSERRLSSEIYGIVKRHVDLDVYVTDRRGEVLYDSRGPGSVGENFSKWNDVYLTLKGRYGARSTRVDEDDPASSHLYVAAPIRGRGGEIIGVVTVIKPQDSVTPFMDLLKKRIIIAGIIACLVFILLSLVMSFWISRPLSRLTDYVKNLKARKHAPMPRLGSSEIRTLGEAFQEMRDELEGKKFIERYIQTLTHELKSPLTSIRGSAELLLEEMPDDQKAKFHRNILTESKRIDSIIRKLVQLSVIENRQEPENPEEIDLLPLSEEILEALTPQVIKKGISIDNCLTHGDVVVGEKFLVRHALSNLIENAVRFTGEGGAVEISAERKDAFIEIRVSDNGEGIPEYAVGRVFERFYSLPNRGSHEKGTGLGLSFVKEAAELHGGTAEVFNNDGPGATSLLRLPAPR